MKWEARRNETNAQVYLYVRNLFTWRDRQVRLHKIVKHDPIDQFHSHPSWAIRIILWGGYLEQVHEPALRPRKWKQWRRWRPGMIGFVRPHYTHRIAHVWGGASYSLWIHGKPRWPTFLRGTGWPPYLRNRGV